MTSLLESRGIIIVPCDFYTDKISGRVMLTENGTPVIFINKDQSGDRLRYTLAHELAHLIMHLFNIPTGNSDTEREAELFAGEFMMPSREIKPQLSGKLTISKLADLKRVWRMSMQSILHRAEDIGTIQPNQARYLWSQFNTMGMKKVEPVNIPFEQPKLLRKIIDFHLNTLDYSEDDLIKLLCYEKEEFKELFYYEQSSTLRMIR